MAEDATETVLAALDAWIADIGHAPAYLSLWCSWKAERTAPRGRWFPAPALLEGIRARGVAPVIFWEPDLPSNAGHNDRIVSGEWDEYLVAWAMAASTAGPVIVRFAHEQNGTWFPWSPRVNGNTDASYKAMWRHVVDVVRPIAPDLRWFWCFNGAGQDPALTYPGSLYVDIAGLDGYGWNAYAPPFHMANEPRLRYLRTLGKPIMVGEFGVAAVGPQEWRASWLRRSLVGLEDAGVMGALYFDIDMQAVNGKHPDWRLKASPGIAYVLRRQETLRETL